MVTQHANQKATLKNAQKTQEFKDQITALKVANVVLKMEVWFLRRIMDAKELHQDELDDIDREYYATIGRCCVQARLRIKEVKTLDELDFFILKTNAILASYGQLQRASKEGQANKNAGLYIQRAIVDTVTALRGEIDD